MLIGILHCGHAPDEVRDIHGDFDRLFSNLLEDGEFTYQTWNVVDGEFPNDPNLVDGWILSGSKHGAYEDHAFIPPLETLIRDIYAAAVPMVGICFGHQIIAQALGGRVEKFDGGWALGHHEYEFDGMGKVALNAFHQDQVLDVPKDAKVIARSEFCANAALVYGDKAFTMQPHPEFSNEIFGAYVPARRHLVGTEKNWSDALEKIEKPIQDNLVAKQIIDFLRTAHSKRAAA